MKFAIIGCGRISYKHVEALVHNRESAVLEAVCDNVVERAQKRSIEYAQAVAAAAAPSVYANYIDMLREADIDVVVIATESGYHAEIAKYCMYMQKHVIVEKPMALSTNDADEMIEVARANGVKLCICHQNRFNKSIVELREALTEGRFGKLINGTARILWARDMNYYKQAPWRGTWAQDGGTLMNQCIHNIDLLQWMLGGEIDTVYAQTGNYIRDIEAEDFGTILIRFKNGTIGLVEGSACVYPKNLEETLSIFGDRGTACIGGLAVNKIETWRFADNKDKEEDVLLEQQDDPDSVYGYGHIPLYKDMIEAVRDGREPLVNGEEGRKGMQIILAAYKSQKTGQPVKYDGLKFATIDMRNEDVR